MAECVSSCVQSLADADSQQQVATLQGQCQVLNEQLSQARKALQEVRASDCWRIARHLTLFVLAQKEQAHAAQVRTFEERVRVSEADKQKLIGNCSQVESGSCLRCTLDTNLFFLFVVDRTYS